MGSHYYSLFTIVIRSEENMLGAQIVHVPMIRCQTRLIAYLITKNSYGILRVIVIRSDLS
jgi:hypothetical protein